MPRCRFHKDCRSKTILSFLTDRQTHQDKHSAENKYNRTTKTGLLKPYETDQPNLARDRQCQTVRRRHPTPTKPRTNEQETADIRIQRRLHVRRRMCGWIISGFRNCQHVHEINGLLAKTASNLNANDDQTATRTFQQFFVFGLLLLSCGLERLAVRCGATIPPSSSTLTSQ